MSDKRSKASSVAAASYHSNHKRQSTVGPIHNLKIEEAMFRLNNMTNEALNL